MNRYPQNRHEWLRYVSVTVHGCGIGLLALCQQIASIVNPPMELLYPYSQALKIALAVQAIVTVALFVFDRHLAVWSLGITVVVFVLLPFATAIKES